MHAPSRIRAAGLGLALAATGTAQALATLAVFALPVLVTQAAAAYGLPTSAIGHQVGLVYLLAALSSLGAARVLGALGPLRATQAALVAAAAGLAALAAGALWLAVPASALLGAAYGLTNPAAAQLLGRLAPAGRRNLVFAVKQMGVPLGVALGGLILPPLAQTLGWQGAMLAAALLLALFALLLQPLRAGWDAAREAASGPAARFRLRESPGLSALALTGAGFALVQIALAAHMVAMLVAEFGWSPVAAGALVGLCQTVGALARLLWALLADRWGSGARVLALIGLLSALALLLLPLLPGAEGWAVALLFAAIGATTAGWNGVLIAESVRLAPPGRAGAASGAVLSLTFAGAVLGPPVLALASGALGGYTAAFALSALVCLGGAWAAWRLR
ncbi:MAG: MFS transporter [Roseococcus sp.]|nr:MFS transporter [Roseococcus sp.]